MQSTTTGRWLGTLAIGLIAAVWFGQPVPSGVERIYVPLLRSFADPSYLEGDWTFEVAFADKFVFNAVFSPLVNAVGVDAAVWIGRGVLWLAVGRLLVALGERLGSRVWTTVLSVAVLMGIDWSAGFAAANLFGRFAAATAGTVLVIGAYVLALDKRVGWALLLVGLGASVHPAVGLWSGGALIVALLATRETRPQTVRALPIAVVAAVPGLIVSVGAWLGSESLASDVELVVLERLSHHVDPFSFGERGPLILGLMSASVLVCAYLGRSDYRLRLVGAVSTVLVGVVLVGVVARAVGWFEFLLLTPFRGAAGWIPLLFFLLLVSSLRALGGVGWGEIRSQWAYGAVLPALVALTLVAIATLWNPISGWGEQVEETVSSWNQETTDLEVALNWIAGNTPPSSLIVSPPWIDEIFLWSERPQLASWEAVAYDQVSEWRSRIELTLAEPSLWWTAASDRNQLLDSYTALTLEHWHDVRSEYGLDYVVTQAEYGLQPAFVAGDWVVYDLS